MSILNTSTFYLNKLVEKGYKITIFDPDGWDRTNYDYSFNEELITPKEFLKRLFFSTIMSNKDVSKITDEDLT